MLYNPPTGAQTANDNYVGKNTAAGTQGSKIPPGAIEYPQREIVNVIQASGLAPTNTDLAQMLRAIRSGRLHYGVDVGAQNALAIAFAVPHVAPVAGLRFLIKPKTTNSGPATLTVDTLTATPIVRSDGAALNAGDIVANRLAMVAYNDVLSAYQMIGIPGADLAKLVGLPNAVIGNGFAIAPAVSSIANLFAAQAIPNNVETAVSWSSVTGALPGEWSVGNPSRLYIPAIIRKIRVQYEVCFEANATGSRKARILMDGVFEGSGLPAERKPSGSGADVTILQGAGGVFDLTQGGAYAADGTHYVQLMASQDSGGVLNMRSGNTWCSIDFLA